MEKFKLSMNGVLLTLTGVCVVIGLTTLIYGAVFVGEGKVFAGSVVALIIGIMFCLVLLIGLGLKFILKKSYKGVSYEEAQKISSKSQIRGKMMWYVFLNPICADKQGFYAMGLPLTNKTHDGEKKKTQDSVNR